MKLNLQTNEVFSGGMSETASFKVEMNAMMFHSVIDGIYSDKIRSPFRELCTNARDGHSARGNLDEPFDVFLPSTLNPTFKVRDYGIGLSHDDVMGLYTTMFASSKRDSNNAVGMIGLGSKSPFAYTTAFTVTSWHGGWESIYSAYIGEDGVPKIAVMSRRESNQREGMEISMPVQQKDIQTFRNAAPDVLFGFEPFPNVLNEKFTRAIPAILHEGKGWKFYNHRTPGFPFQRMMAKQGCVLYPIDKAPLNIPVPARPSGYGYGNDNLDFFTWPIVLEFEIGELDVATSREALGNTPKTIEAIKARINSMKADFARILETETNSKNTYLEACEYYTNATGASGPTRALWQAFGSSVTYKGRTLKTRFEGRLKDKATDSYEICQIRKTNMQSASDKLNQRTLETINFRVPKHGHLFALTAKELQRTQFWVEYPDVTFGTSRMKNVVRNLPDDVDTVIWIRPSTAMAVGRAIENFEKPVIHDLSTVERMISATVTKEERKKVQDHVSFRYLSTSPNYKYDRECRYETLIPHDQMVCVIQENDAWEIDGKQWPWQTFSQGISELTRYGLLPQNLKIYFLNKTHRKLTFKHKSVTDAILEKVKADNALETLASASGSASRKNKVEISKKLVELSTSETLALPEASYFLFLSTQDPKAVTLDRKHKLAQHYLKPVLEQEAKRLDALYERYDTIMAKYPMLETSSSSPQLFRHYMELLSK